MKNKNLCSVFDHDWKTKTQRHGVLLLSRMRIYYKSIQPHKPINNNKHYSILGPL
jgi:hypothetical protein